MLPEENKQFLQDKSVPLWQRILNLDASRFERSKYAGQYSGSYRLRDLSLLREMAPGVYQAAAGEVKEYNEALFQRKGQIKKYKLGRKLGSIPIIDINLHPELGHDKVAQDKYFSQHPELRTNG